MAAFKIFHDEWMHRDTTLIKQVYIFYISALTVIMLPHLTIVKDQFIEKIPSPTWFIVGVIVSLAFLYYSYGYSLRSLAASRTLEKVYDTLKQVGYERKSLEAYIEEGKNKLIKLRLIKRILVAPISSGMSILLFFSLIVVNIIVNLISWNY